MKNQAQILIGDNDLILQYISEFKVHNFIKDYNILNFSDRLKIQNVKEIRHFFSRVQSDDEKRLIIVTSDATIDAQNALLKTLEELPPNTYFLWSVLSSKDILPTILSRCFLKSFTSTEKKSRNDMNQISFHHLSLNSFHSFLKVSEKVQTVEDVEKMIKSFENVLKEEVLKGGQVPFSFYKMLKKISENISLLSTNNINSRMLIEAIMLAEIEF